MHAGVDPEIFDRSAEEGARRAALELVAESELAAQRLSDGRDPEALHDFRVGLRRLRTILRAFRPWLGGSAGRKLEKRLEKVARKTNVARDAEVQLRFLRDQQGALGARQRPGLEFLRGRFEARRRAGERSAGELAGRYARISRKLDARLDSYVVHLDAASRAPRFGAIVACVAWHQLSAVRERLAAVSGPADEEHVHRARIEGKRLRYLLELLRGHPRADSGRAVKRLKRLQDVLGGIHDMHVLSHELASALADADAEEAGRLREAMVEGRERRRASPVASPGPGVRAVQRLVSERRDALFSELGHEWGADRVEELATEISRLVDALDDRHEPRRGRVSSPPKG